MELREIAGLTMKKIEALRKEFNQLIECVEPLKKLTTIIDSEFDKVNDPILGLFTAVKIMTDIDLEKNTMDELNRIDSGADIVMSIGESSRLMSSIQDMYTSLRRENLIPAPRKFAEIAFELNNQLDKVENVLKSDKARNHIYTMKSELLYISTLLTKEIVRRA